MAKFLLCVKAPGPRFRPCAAASAAGPGPAFRRIGVIRSKGGVGKATTAVNPALPADGKGPAARQPVGREGKNYSTLRGIVSAGGVAESSGPVVAPGDLTLAKSASWSRSTDARTGSDSRCAAILGMASGLVAAETGG